MYDQAFYNDAAERIPPSVFAPLRDTPTPSDHNAMDVPAVVIRFTPGDSTLYEILIARGRNAEAIVVVANMRLVFGVPWHDGAYVHPSYLAGQATHVNDLTMMAVAAVTNRAIDVCHDTGRDAVDLIHEIRGTR
jgi:hypothetical protein